VHHPNGIKIIIGQAVKLQFGKVHFIELFHGRKIFRRVIIAFIQVQPIIPAVGEQPFCFGRRMVACANVKQFELLISKRFLEIRKFRAAPAEKFTDTQTDFFAGRKILKK
jgi:hypothetical protein